jgi:hypothetical protein
MQSGSLYEEEENDDDDEDVDVRPFRPKFVQHSSIPQPDHSKAHKTL